MVLSVTKALNAASFAVLPKKVITQSIMTIIVPLKKTLLATKLKDEEGSKKAKNKMDKPHIIYPMDIRTFLLPNLSLTAPINNVVIVAVAALAITIAVMKL